MADSVRLAILKQLTTYLQTEITTTNGYQHTLTGAVFRGRFWLSGAEDPIPMLSILEALNPDRDPQRAGYERGTMEDEWILLVQGWVTDDPENPTDPAHNLMADVKRAIGKLAKQVYDAQLSGTAFEHVSALTFEPGTVRPPDELSERAYFWMRIVLKVVEDTEALFWSP